MTQAVHLETDDPLFAAQNRALCDAKRHLKSGDNRRLKKNENMIKRKVEIDLK